MKDSTHLLFQHLGYQVLGETFWYDNFNGGITPNLDGASLSPRTYPHSVAQARIGDAVVNILVHLYRLLPHYRRMSYLIRYVTNT